MLKYSSPGIVSNQSVPNEAMANFSTGLIDESAMAWEPIQPGLTSCEATIEGRVDAFTQPPRKLANQRHVEVDAVRDGQFYIDSADCVIRVDNTLFRVHRYFVGRDSSAFQDMFDMPTPHHILSHKMEGCSDDNPIWLYGESLERFRALLSVIYDLPLQLQTYSTPEADVDRLLTIAEMSNKYHFTSMETWAVNALHNVISGLQGPPQPQYDLSHCSSAWMKRLLEIAFLCSHTPLCNYVTDRWVDRIADRDLRPFHALEVADRTGNRQLQGYAYYIQLLEMDDDFEPGVVEDGKQYSRLVTALIAAGAGGNGPVTPGTPATLTREQKERLLLGHRSLSRLWDRLRKNAPHLQQSVGCTNHQQGCVPMWTQAWRDVGKAEATLKHPVEDVPGRLRAMEQLLFMNADMRVHLSRALSPQCQRAAVAALKVIIKEVQDGLVEHFVFRGDTTHNVAAKDPS